MMAATMKGPVAVEDVNVTFEDQQKINEFARNTSRMTELKNEIEAKKVSTVSCDHHNTQEGSPCGQICLQKSYFKISRTIMGLGNNIDVFRPDTVSKLTDIRY
uniref:Prefoldin subunit 4 n=1 Tax=Anoplopoma fimbria TaxID=229290 RepID=C3KJH5_ANOFI|nr:Prefoldin subunit 4 [Anoplopoma fimbria]